MPDIINQCNNEYYLEDKMTLSMPHCSLRVTILTLQTHVQIFYHAEQFFLSLWCVFAVGFVAIVLVLVLFLLLLLLFFFLCSRSLMFESVFRVSDLSFCSKINEE